MKNIKEIFHWLRSPEAERERNLAIFAAALSIVCVIGLTTVILNSCSKTPEEPQPDQMQFVKLNSYNGITVYVDKDTRVQYLYNYNQGGLTVRVDADGNPMLYEGELD